MGDRFTRTEWEKINQYWKDRGDREFFLPERDDSTIVFGSWNLVHFGKLDKSEEEPVRSEEALDLITNFCARCDLLAVQEVMDDMTAIRYLLARMREAKPKADYRLICSDLAGRSPDGIGWGERHAFIYDGNKIVVGEIASDLNYDLEKVISEVDKAMTEIREKMVRESDSFEVTKIAKNLLLHYNPLAEKNITQTFQFLRSPHFVTFTVLGMDESNAYDIGCVNTHLVSGTKKEREREFFTLLEFLMRRSGINGQKDAEILLLLGDLNLDFDRKEHGKGNDARRKAIDQYVVDLNKQRKQGMTRVNFPFLDPHPVQETIFTNSRTDETFDHIAWFADDDRLPRARFNKNAGQHGFDYGMFDFQKMLVAAGPGLDKTGKLRFDVFKRELSDHMPIWLRLPKPSANQHRYVVPERD